MSATPSIINTPMVTTLPANTLPPPYTPSAHTYLGGDDDDEEETQPTSTFNIHAPTSVHGSGNIIALPPPDVSRLTAAVIATVTQKLQPTFSRSINIQINCGVHVIGDRNIIGSPAIKPLASTQQQRPAASGAQSNDTARARSVPIPIYSVNKRRAEEDPEDSPAPKRPAASTASADRDTEGEDATAS